ncbi:hypothetical protein C7445_101418 [Alicyclobacillus sacchari]|uniref:Cytoskeletal protein CcmA (Bactofilin family) n=1 Tax=Alicyclobacillus sacchari TaxID=392010 RepID=A0A4R8LXJ0_9BACL|nr:hypothetical protein [Alicyclobacillus sacchari]TDY51416.1 hypothetical protein C7445_101418 [Alicyclobacillus sacchari]GMA56759.1 hypothetical protein GCM10025858_12620 [Alicyclobacillus sacchari]
MQTEMGHDLHLSGHGSSTGGFYRNVHLEGLSTIDGDVVCEQCTAHGVARMHGNLRADMTAFHGKADVLGDMVTGSAEIHGTIRVSGVCDVAKILRIHGTSRLQGGVRADVLNIHGRTHVGAECVAREVELHGIAQFAQDIRAERMDCSGVLHLGGPCEAESFSCKGQVHSSGLINAERVHIRLHAKSEVQEIGCTELRVERGRGWFARRHKLVVDIIEGDHIYVENVVAKRIRGNRITLGNGVYAERVEYREELNRHHGAKVKEAVQV